LIMKKAFTVLGIIITVIFVGLGIRYVYYLVLDAYAEREIALKWDESEVSGIYPHLAVFNENHATEKPGETGIGAVVPWGDNLYAITYSAHRPKGSSDKLYVIDKRGRMESYPLSIGGTPANRMIHKESRQLIIGPYFISETGAIRMVPIEDMPGRLTATARHLTDPKNKVYFYTMEEGLYEVDVYSLEVNELYPDGNVRTPPDVAGPLLPGYHGKGAYSSQDRLVVANNGEYRWQSTPESGCLAEWNGLDWKVIERKQFTEVTGPGGLYGNEKKSDPIWAIGWDEKSLILKVRENGDWDTYRLPKASFTYDGRHGWHTEWPRIRDIGRDQWLMTMHGMFWAFPPEFSRKNMHGLRPLSSYLKIIPDFSPWNGLLVMACDDASMFDNDLVGQPQSNFWFIHPEQLDQFGPRIGFAKVWEDEEVEAYQATDPYLVSGFGRMNIYADEADDADVILNVERRTAASSNWELWKAVPIGDSKLVNVVLEVGETEWVRFVLDQDVEGISVGMHLSPVTYPEKSGAFFKALQPRGSADINMGWLRPSGENGDLQIFSPGKSYTNLDENFEFTSGEMDEDLTLLSDKLVPKNSPITKDSASIIYTDKTGQRWRLPFGYTGRNDMYEDLNPRTVREVATERSLLNAGGLFYELPREISGGISKVKPICTHNKMIMDFCSWRGMMAITGSNPRAKSDDHFQKENEGFGVWLGTIDDLWDFPKPSGIGGPWFNTEVEAGEVSDPYLMYGFDVKAMKLSHDLDTTVEIELLGDFSGDGEFRLIQVIQVNSGAVRSVEFEEGFSAFWVMLRAKQKCRATATFEYR
jgi:hypothetical protein